MIYPSICNYVWIMQLGRIIDSRWGVGQAKREVDADVDQGPESSPVVIRGLRLVGQPLEKHWAQRKTYKNQKRFNRYHKSRLV